MGEVKIGTAGWSVPRQHAARFPAEGSGLQRYAARLNCAEINSSFYRPHRRSTYERWAASTPVGFAFAVKAPRELTHIRRLTDPAEPLTRFLDEISGLGGKLGPVLIQLPPGLAFDATTAEPFLAHWRDRFAGDTVIEPRHPTWFEPGPDSLLAALRIARVAADPARVPDAAHPGGWPGLRYWRLHGSPRTYSSTYAPERLAALAAEVAVTGVRSWCVFDNTMHGWAAANALDLAGLLGPKPHCPASVAS